MSKSSGVGFGRRPVPVLARPNAEWAGSGPPTHLRLRGASRRPLEMWRTRNNTIAIRQPFQTISELWVARTRRSKLVSERVGFWLAPFLAPRQRRSPGHGGGPGLRVPFGGNLVGEGKAHHEGIVCPQCDPIATLGVYPLAACCRPTLATLPHSPGCEIRATTFGGTVRGRSGISAGLSFCALPSQEKRQAPRGIGYPISPGRFLLSLVIGCTRIVG